MKILLEDWLMKMGLELKKSKTRLTPTLSAELSEDKEVVLTFLDIM